MRKRVGLAVGVCVVAFLLFFFLVPVVWSDIIPCFVTGDYGYTSLSYHFFHVGEIHLNHGGFQWTTANLSDCF